jgi:hypothetical protein
MRRTLGVGLLAILLLACSAKKRPAAAPDAAPAAVIATVPDAAPPPAPPEPPRKQHRITLRSTPTGAAVKIDGHAVGSTPTVAEVVADDQVHEFVFTLDGYAPQRYTFPPVKDGVVHASLKPLSVIDAGLSR